jgi:hypothetical protein
MSLSPSMSRGALSTLANAYSKSAPAIELYVLTPRCALCAHFDLLACGYVMLLQSNLYTSTSLRLFRNMRHNCTINTASGPTRCNANGFLGCRSSYGKDHTLTLHANRSGVGIGTATRNQQRYCIAQKRLKSTVHFRIH